jgi:peptidyl-prolyl cis-trans isomerase C
VTFERETDPAAPGRETCIRVNGVPVDGPAAAVRELLRQRAVDLGLVAADADEAEADAGIERLLEREVQVPEPGEAECRR